MREKYVLELLDEASEILEVIRNYHTITRPKVKNILENLRSSLEYLANDINEKMSEPNKGKLYFPYHEGQDGFEKIVKKSFPLLKAERPEIYNEIVKIQPFSCGDEWLSKMCQITNDVKHNNPIDIRKSEDAVKSITAYVGDTPAFMVAGNCSNAVFSNNYVNGKLVDDFIYNNGELIITKKGESSLDFK
ncbi:hypothetical protein OHW85_20635, partial [Acinetobacter baumannii]|nr:hypothetical protein [Acinetobacter baumannii]